MCKRKILVVYIDGYQAVPMSTVVLFFLLLHLLPARVSNLQALLVTKLPGSVGLSPHLLGSPEPNSGCKSYFRQSRILTIWLPFMIVRLHPPTEIPVLNDYPSKFFECTHYFI